jgi:hypothetical protein
VVGITFYVGLGLLIVSIGIELARARLSQLRLGLHAAALIVILYGSAPLIYREGRYAWLYKTLGIIQYISTHGHVDRSLDIYENWPGFFALAGWFDRVAGVSNPLDYAKWAQLVLEFAALPLLYDCYRSLALPVRQRWLAVFLYFGANWIGQDYLSPQGLATVLTLGILAMVLRWMHAGNSAGQMEDGSAEYIDVSKRRYAVSGDREPKRKAPAWSLIVAFLLLFFVLTFVHELSPYILVMQLLALVVIGLMRPRWAAFAALVIALAYLAPNFSFVESHDGLLSSIGKFFGNIQPPVSNAAPEPSQAVIAHCEMVLSIGMWLLALVGAWFRRKSLRTVIGLLSLTFAPILVLAIQAYGNEGILRVYLFSLPWAAALASSALVPLKSLSDARQRSRAAGSAGSSLLHTFDRGTLRAPLILACLIGLFLVSFFGDDTSNVMSSSEVTTLLTFMENAQPGPVICALGNAPVSDTANYNQWPTAAVFGGGSVLGTEKFSSDIDQFLARTAEHFTDGTRPAYVIVSPAMLAYNKEYGLAPSADLAVLRDSLAKSRYWKQIINKGGIVVFQITAAAVHMPVGPYNPNPTISAP